VKIDIQLTQRDILKGIVKALEEMGHAIKPDSVVFRSQGSRISNVTAEVTVFSDGHCELGMEPPIKDGTTMKMALRKYEPKSINVMTNQFDGPAEY